MCFDLRVNPANAPPEHCGIYLKTTCDRKSSKCSGEFFPSIFSRIARQYFRQVVRKVTKSSELFSFPLSDEPQGHSFRPKFMSKFGTEMRAYPGGLRILTDDRRCSWKQRWQAIQFWLSVKRLKP